MSISGNVEGKVSDLESRDDELRNRKLIVGKVSVLEAKSDETILDFALNCNSNACQEICTTIFILNNATDVKDFAFEGF